jgi:glucokinase
MKGEAKMAVARLLADIGGTNVRLAVQRGAEPAAEIMVLATEDYESLHQAALSYLGRVGRPADLKLGAFAIASPITGDLVSMTNLPWQFSTEEVRRALGLDMLMVVNDFVAAAHAVPYLPATDLIQIGGEQPVPLEQMALIGPGTGLGTSGLVPSKDGWIVIEAEGGHVTMAPANDRESAILARLRPVYGHVSAERVVSGMGLVNLYTAIAGLEGRPVENLEPPDIARKAAEGACAVCKEAVDTFCAMLGTVAGNLVLTLGARGGLYIGGGIVPKLGEAFFRSDFRRRFEDKGRFQSYLAPVPAYLIVSKYPAFIGLQHILDRIDT